jgi:FkbM family methyltransferase
MDSMPRQVLEMVDGCRVVVPDSIELVTPYVLRERGDWFEDEIRFVRRALEPGQRAIDIGANYGLFTLSMARSVGAGGHVWAFEPASATASFLEASLRENAVANVTLRRAGVSSRAGTAELSLNASPELNEIVRGGGSRGPTERIELCSLDELDAAGTWDRVDFLKIDADHRGRRVLPAAPLPAHPGRGDGGHEDIARAGAGLPPPRLPGVSPRARPRNPGAVRPPGAGRCLHAQPDVLPR